MSVEIIVGAAVAVGIVASVVIQKFVKHPTAVVAPTAPAQPQVTSAGVTIHTTGNVSVAPVVAPVASVTATATPSVAPVDDPFKKKNEFGGGFGGYDAAADIARVAKENAWLATLPAPDYSKVDLAALGALSVPPKRIADNPPGYPTYEDSKMNILRRGMAGETLTLEEQVYVLGGPFRFSGLVDGSPATRM